MPTFSSIRRKHILPAPAPTNRHRRSDLHCHNQNTAFTLDMAKTANENILYSETASIHPPRFHSTARYLKYLEFLTASGTVSISPILRRKISAQDTAARLLFVCARISQAIRYPPVVCRYVSTARLLP